MQRKEYVFGFDAEPADERPTGFGQSEFALAIAPTAPAPWMVSEHSTFDEPSHAFERVADVRRERARRARLGIWIALLAVTAITATAWIAGMF